MDEEFSSKHEDYLERKIIIYNTQKLSELSFKVKYKSLKDFSRRHIGLKKKIHLPVKEMQAWVQFLGLRKILKQEIAAMQQPLPEIPQTEESGGLLSIGTQ